MGFFLGGKYLSFIPLVSGMPNGHIAHWFRICVTLSYVKRNEVRLARLVLLTALQTSTVARPCPKVDKFGEKGNSS